MNVSGIAVEEEGDLGEVELVMEYCEQVGPSRVSPLSIRGGKVGRII